MSIKARSWSWADLEYLQGIGGNTRPGKYSRNVHDLRDKESRRKGLGPELTSRPEGPGRQLRVMTGGPAGTEDHDDKKARTENVSKGKVPVTTRDLLLMMRA